MSRAFSVAYFFRTPPTTVLALDVVELCEWETQAHRIAAELRAGRE